MQTIQSLIMYLVELCVSLCVEAMSHLKMQLVSELVLVGKVASIRIHLKIGMKQWGYTYIYSLSVLFLYLTQTNGLLVLIYFASKLKIIEMKNEKNRLCTDYCLNMSMVSILSICDNENTLSIKRNLFLQCDTH